MQVSAVVYIYGLHDPDTGELRYIGKANNLKKRLASHIRDSRARDTPLYMWIRKLTAQGKCPEIRLIAESDADSWESVERAQIAAARESGLWLLNLAKGGNQPFCPIETARANAIALNKRLNDATDKEKKIAAVKRRMGQFLRAGVVNERTKEKMRYAAIRWPEHFAKWALVQ